AIDSGSAPDLKTTVSPLRMSFAVMVVLGAQRVGPVNPGVEGMDYAGTLELLLDRGVDPEVATIVGSTPLHLATAISPLPQLVRILLKHGARVDSRNRYGETPLFCAVATNEPLAAELLLDAGADLDIQNADGISPIMIKAREDVAAVLQKWARKRAGSAWKSHKPSCTSFKGPATLSMQPTYLPDGMYGSLVSTAPMVQGMAGMPASMKARSVKTKSATKIKYPKPMIVKIQAPMGPSMTTGGMLVYDKKREFVAYLNPSGGRDAYLALRKLIAEQGVGGLKAYFAAELVTQDELTVKSEVLAPQEF
ncbi:ankyrin, partial [Auricularia subglabra TFB-10046 SS5]